jgi:hypothetical protein
MVIIGPVDHDKQFALKVTSSVNLKIKEFAA